MANFCSKSIIQFVSLLIAAVAAPVATAAKVSDAAWTQLQYESRVRVMVVLADVAARGGNRALAGR